MAGVTCAGLLIFVLVGENLGNLGVLLKHPALPALVLGGAIVALLLGSLLIARPGPRVVRWSSVAGIPWLIAFGSLVIGPHDEPGPILSSTLITGFGVAGALLAYWSRLADRRLN
jgi:hypothetical protein